jgi:hypothetical protein
MKIEQYNPQQAIKDYRALPQQSHSNTTDVNRYNIRFDTDVRKKRKAETARPDEDGSR